MVTRYTDKSYFTFTANSASDQGIEVKCPQCGKLAIVKMADGEASCSCTHCNFRQQKDLRPAIYSVKLNCSECQRYFRCEIDDPQQQHFKILNVTCPHCGAINQGPVQKTIEPYGYIYKFLEDGSEPYFGYKLWYQTSYQGKLIWAINRSHLIYLIDYLSADLRQKPYTYPMRTQADHLPTFIKTAKNRDRIVTLLKRLLA